MNATASAVARKAAALVPVRTGFLEANIRWQPRPRSVSAVVGFDKRAFYWRFVEYGTVRMAAKPFIRPAALSQVAQHQKELRAALERAANIMERSAGSFSQRFL